MSEILSKLKSDPKAFWAAPEMQARLRRRHYQDQIFKNVGRGAILFSIFSSFAESEVGVTMASRLG